MAMGQTPKLLPSPWNRYQALGIDCPPVFVAFDECVELIVPKPGRKTEDHQLNSLRRAWHHLLELQAKKNTETFWLVLLSTNTGAAELIVPQNLQGSTRARDEEPLPIFVGLGFDVLRGEQPALASPSDAFDTRYVRSYGRPLWASLPFDTFWEVAQLKLLGARPLSSTESEVCYNLLAARLSLQSIPTHLGDAALFSKQKTLATKSVDRHMRILQRVVDHTSLMVSAPSEPVLAIAAALIMLKDTSRHSDSGPRPPPNYAAVIDTFTTQSLPTLGPAFLKGAHGEFMARFAMMAAWDAIKLDLRQSKRRNRDQGDRRDAASIHHIQSSAAARLSGTSCHTRSTRHFGGDKCYR